ncbi:putative ribonuclease H-like domain-containing protein [Tanacetum coccineum]|uniref:Ribonuclease H-like domain-containing protein n=1 Tax=Tanacetum coccineum TaxID=301880 RepID=A0ABQ5GF29_9ASTR
MTFVPSGVLTRTGLINPVRPNEKRAVQTINTARLVSTARWVWRPKGNYLDHVSKDDLSCSRRLKILLHDHAVMDSGCSSHMTGNKAYLSDYEDYNGGFVAFRSDPKGAYDDENVGAMADFNNMDDTINVSPIPTLKIHKNNPKDQILGDPKSAVQTRGKIQKASSAQQALKTQNISQALQDESWVEAMQEELLQFKLQKVWILVDLPSGKKEEGIDYDEVFAPVAKIEAIRLFLAFAPNIDNCLQKDVKSAYLYGTLKMRCTSISLTSLTKFEFVPSEQLLTPKSPNKTTGQTSLLLFCAYARFKSLQKLHPINHKKEFLEAFSNSDLGWSQPSKNINNRCSSICRRYDPLAKQEADYYGQILLLEQEYVVAANCTDIANIIRKRSKPDKHEHRNG